MVCSSAQRQCLSSVEVATPNHRGADCEDSVINKILKTYKMLWLTRDVD